MLFIYFISIFNDLVSIHFQVAKIQFFLLLLSFYDNIFFQQETKTIFLKKDRFCFYETII